MSQFSKEERLMIRRMLAAMALVCVVGPPAGAQVKLEFKVAEGTTERHKVESKLHQIVTIMDMDIETNLDQAAMATAANGTRKADGTLPIETTLDSLKMKMSLPGGIEINLDSADKDLKVDLPQLAFIADMLKAIRGTSYTVVLDAKNNVKSVEGTEKNLAKVNEMPKQAAEGLRHHFDPDRIKREYEQIHTIFPDGLVREGEPWEHTETNEVGGGQSLTFKKQYEYKGTVKKGDKTLDKIAVKALDVTYKMDPNPEAPAKVTKSDLKIDSSEGMILFDREAGAVVERHDKTRIKGDMSLSAGGKDLEAKLDLTIETNATVEQAGK